jgi:hypothetical protein
MSAEAPEKVEVIQLPNTLRAKVGGRMAAIDPEMIAKAEAALDDLSSHFSDWMADEVAKVEAAYARLKAEGLNPQTLENVYLCVHDLKGLGTTYGYPLVTRISASFCRMCDEVVKRNQAPMVLVTAHMETIRIIIRDEIKSEDHPVGTVLAKTLEDRVSEHLTQIGCAS